MDIEKEYKRKALEPIVNYIESVLASYSKEELEARIKEALPKRDSEDERIRKMLIEIVNITPASLAIKNRSKLLAYLEKQKEKTNQTQVEREYVRTLKSLIADFLRGKEGIDRTYYQDIYDWLDGYHVEQKPDEWSDNFEENIRILLHDKLTWHSEDGSMSSAVFIDDKTLKDIINGIWFYVGKEALKYPNKELPQSEWSEEDRGHLDRIQMVLESWDRSHTSLAGLPSTIPDDIAWLKSLRPLPHWKPSKEQMNALKVVARGFPADDPDAIDSLLTDLQKLL